MSVEHTYDLIDIRVEQATLLKKRVVASCLFVMVIVATYSFILYFTDYTTQALLWLIAASAMVGVVYLYGTWVAPNGVTRASVKAYLTGHIVICCITGLVWSSFAIYLIDWSSYLTIFVACILVFSITIGGMFPNSAYRPGYIGLAVFALLPVALFLLIYAGWPTRLLGVATLVYFLFGLITSARAELDMRETIAARSTQALMKKVKAQNEVIRRVNEERHRFLAATSHDLSQPIHAQGYFIQAMRQHLTETTQHELLDKIELTWERQSQFLRSLMDMNQLDSGTIAPKPAMVELDAELQAVVSEFADQVTEREQVLHCSFEAVQTVTDPILLNRVVRNLLSNAIKYTPTQGTISLGLQHGGQSAIVTVTDTGPGIALEDQKRIFEEYVQLETEGSSRTGVGLGLSIVKRLCKLLDITLNVASTPGEGTTFTLYIPFTDTLPEAKQEAGGQTQMHRFTTAPLVFLVDDEETIRDGMSNLLTDWGCQVISTGTSDTALDLLAATPQNPDLLLIDKMLGSGQSGIDLIARLREEVNEDTPAVLMSGGFLSDADRGAMTDTQFLAKPVEPALLYQTLERIVR
ncbi:ATP-binding protein [Kordiimonas sp.]|uniref:ATP-binding protein n=1 Tax=Kordiimonas sp. TaxID=1970157 RepID=UPI003B52E1E3